MVAQRSKCLLWWSLQGGEKQPKRPKFIAILSTRFGWIWHNYTNSIRPDTLVVPVIVANGTEFYGITKHMVHVYFSEAMRPVALVIGNPFLCR